MSPSTPSTYAEITSQPTAWAEAIRLVQSKRQAPQAASGIGGRAVHRCGLWQHPLSFIACSERGTPDTAGIPEPVQVAGVGVHLGVLGYPDHDALLCRPRRRAALECVPDEATPELSASSASIEFRYFCNRR